LYLGRTALLSSDHSSSLTAEFNVAPVKAKSAPMTAAAATTTTTTREEDKADLVK
jgi:hypothetical protein